MRALGYIPIILTIALLFSQAAGAITLPPVNVPYNVIRYVPITITNTNSTPTPQGFQQAVTLNAIKAGFPTGLYYQNIEFFYRNGTLVKSWLEGFDKVGYTSWNPTYWLKLPSLNWSQSITIYAGTGNVTTNFYAANPGVTGISSFVSGFTNGYDNGAAIFNYYNDFYNGSSKLPSGWASSNTPGVFINNKNYVSISNGSLYTTNPVFFSTGNVVEAYLNYRQNSNSYTGLTVSDTNSPQYGNAGSDEEALFVTGYNTGAMKAFISNGVGTGYDVASNVDMGFTPTLGSFYNYLIALNSTYISEAINSSYAFGFPNPFISTYAGKMMYIILGYFMGAGSGGTNDNFMDVYWVRVRYYPPGNNMPQVSQSNVIEPRSVSLTPQSATTDSGSAVLLTASIQNSTPYDYYKWFDGANVICSGAGTSCNYLLKGAGVHHIVFNLTDQYTTTSANTNIMVNPSLSVAAPTPNTQTVVVGNTATVTDSGAINGTAPYTYKWLEQRPGSSSFVLAADCVAPTTLTCSFTTSQATLGGTYAMELQASDNAYGTGNIIVSAPITIYVNNGMTSNQISTTTTTATTTVATTTTVASTSSQATTSATTTSISQGGGQGGSGGSSGGINISTGTGLIALAVVILIIAVAYYFLRMKK